MPRKRKSRRGEIRAKQPQLVVTILFSLATELPSHGRGRFNPYSAHQKIPSNSDSFLPDEKSTLTVGDRTGSGDGHPMSTAGQLGAQAIGVGAAVVWSAIGTYLVVKFLEASVGARVSLEEKRNGVERAGLSSKGLR